ncbi:hypothetical protein OF83DRAFT_1157506 [Amylostereum chailletii]|nr:hypothetical protein OF83DRAFT_1157506 [Amylostereum chailletii]
MKTTFASASTITSGMTVGRRRDTLPVRLAQRLLSTYHWNNTCGGKCEHLITMFCQDGPGLSITALHQVFEFTRGRRLTARPARAVPESSCRRRLLCIACHLSLGKCAWCSIALLRACVWKDVCQRVKIWRRRTLRPRADVVILVGIARAAEGCLINVLILRQGVLLGSCQRRCNPDQELGRPSTGCEGGKLVYVYPLKSFPTHDVVLRKARV